MNSTDVDEVKSEVKNNTERCPTMMSFPFLRRTKLLSSYLSFLSSALCLILSENDNSFRILNLTYLFSMRNTGPRF